MNKFEIYLVNLDPTIGAEMKKTRPCVIISPDEMNNNLKTVIVAPITSIARAIPTRIFVKATGTSGLKNDSYIVLDQIKTVDKSRLAVKIGEISLSEQKDLTEALQKMFA